MLARLHRYKLPMATAPLPTRAARRRSRPLTGWLVATGGLVQLGLFMYVVAPGLTFVSKQIYTEFSNRVPSVIVVASIFIHGLDRRGAST